MAVARIRGIQLNYDDAGSGPAFLFVHGHPFDRTMWRPQLAALSGVYRCVMPDLCGYGSSEPRLSTVLLDEMALDLLHLLDHLRIERAVICGLSMGVQITLDLVRLAPQRIAGLVLAAGSARGETPEGIANRRALAGRFDESGTMDPYIDENLLRFFSDQSAREHPEVVTFLEEIMRGCSPTAAAAALRGRAERRDHREALRDIAAPTVVICGDSDAFTLEEEARELSEGIPAATLLWMPGVGHMPNLERPEEFNQALFALGERAYPGSG